MSKSSQIEYSECMTLVTMVVTIYVWILKKNKYTLIQSIFFRVHIPFMPSFSCQFPVSVLSVSFHFLPCSFYFRQSYLCFTFTLFNFPPFLLFFHVLLMFLWFPFRSSHFPSHLLFMSLSFYSLVTSVSFPFFPSSHSIFLVCPVIFQNHIECPCIFVSNYVHGPCFFSWSSLLVYASGCQFIMW